MDLWKARLTREGFARALGVPDGVELLDVRVESNQVDPEVPPLEHVWVYVRGPGAEEFTAALCERANGTS